jgi:hypothetical protein
MTVAERLCRLPVNFRKGSVSTVALMERSGYLSAPQRVERADIAGVLQRHPELVADWLTWSGDQRTPEGWCFDQRGGDSYAVYYPKGEILEFDDQIEACAGYILRVISSLTRHRISN